MKGNLIIISSPSGGGKGTLIKELRETVPDLGYSVSWTTRSRRFGEEEGVHYHFVSEEEFLNEVEAGGFLEHAIVHGHHYGTSKKAIEKILSEGKDAILEIDVQGAIAVMSLIPEAVTIFIMPPSFDILRARLIARATEGATDLELRLNNSRNEVMHYTKFKYVVINGELSAASRRLASIVIAERQRTDRQNDAIQAILNTFRQAKV